MNKYTFWKLIQENTIEIPIIQRDYAQGRNNAKAKRIRKSFLEIIHKKIKEKNSGNKYSSINLDFVYGKIEDKKLIPLDGQQRLTTLFLLHWYLAMKDDKLDENRNTLAKFTYETRVSSREFCQGLVNNKIILNKERLSKVIENKNWFYKSWKKDPTVSSMLQMIDDLHEKFKDTNGLFDELICSKYPPITFDFLPLNEFKLTDELYIKMNARGKPLTDFEDFKAKFVELLSTENREKLDNAWTDLFWEYRTLKEDGYYYIDDRYLNFFTNISLNFFVETQEIVKGNKIELIDIFSIYLSIYSEPKNITRLVSLLDTLCLDNIDTVKDAFKFFIGFKGDDLEKKETKLSYWDRVRFHSITQFLIKNGAVTSLNQEKFDKWIRVTFNLIDNSLIQSPDNFKNAIRSINKLAINMNDIYSFLVKVPKIDFFLQEQVREEIIKAILIEKSTTWRNKIHDIEKHKYFLGQIGFLFKFSKIEDYFIEHKHCNWEENCNKENLFNEYCDIAELIFDENGLKPIYDEYIFERALLSKGDYLLYARGNYSFLINKGKHERDISWKKLLRDSNDSKLDDGSIESRREFVKYLFDDLILCKTEDAITITLNKVINEFECSDWREYFIKYPEIIKECGTNKFIRWKSENNILLLEGERTSGTHREYYTYVLYILVKSSSKVYNAKNSVDVEKSVYINTNEITWDNNIGKYCLNETHFTFDEIVKKLELEIL